MELRFVTAKSQDYRMLADKLDAYYFELLGELQLRYAQTNRPENFARLVVAYQDGIPVGCGCWKDVDPRTAELKRIYVLPQFRRKGVASAIIRLLESDIALAGHSRIILETARTTPGSEALYLSLGYGHTSYYNSPAGADNCLCFDKILPAGAPVC